jgi:GNAT superfamily N-acetyltransferase
MPSPSYAIRPATDADIPELIRLRQVMFDGLEGRDHEPAGDWWHAACAAYLRGGFARGAVVAFVAQPDDGNGAGNGLIGCGVGILEQRLPGHGNGLYGYIQSMATDPEWRGRGLAGGVVDALLAWFRGQGVRSVDLHASRQGEPVYRARGFTESIYAALRWRNV